MFKLFFALLVGKIIFFFSRFLKIGGGYAAPGLYALKVDPNLIEELIDHKSQNIIITGTNGKTTTAKLISHFLKSSKNKVIKNSSGSNLERGIASYLITHTNPLGKLNYDFGVWELDEFAFNSVAPKIKPDVVILMNAFRDQLDRYGEVNTVIQKWRHTLAKLDKETLLIINQDDGGLLKVAEDFKGKVIKIGLKEPLIGGEASTKALTKPDYQAEILDSSDIKATFVSIKFNDQITRFRVPLPGAFNVYNFLASFTVAHLLNIDPNFIEKNLDTFTPAFGRFEELKIKDKEINIFLIKNPVGATQVLETILPHISKKDSLLLALNDNFADGTDVSWIWDAEFEKIMKHQPEARIIVSGSRLYDMALRLKYAEISKDQMIIEQNLETAFEKAVSETEGKLFILPTYTVLMELQKILVNKGIKKEYWKNE